MKYVTKAFIDEPDMQSLPMYALSVFEKDLLSHEDTGLLNARGERLYRVNERAPIGYIYPRRT